jgi:S-adenosylmethionine uptake transporter
MATPPQTPRFGILLMLLGMFLFTVNDTLGKYMVATYSVGQLMFVRSIGGLAMLAPAILREGAVAVVRAAFRPILTLRSVLSVAESFLFYWAVVYLPVADVVTFYMAVPIYTTALAALLLGEAVGWRRWTAVGVGFVGVLIALDPAGGLNFGTVIAVVGSLTFAVSMILTRRLKAERDIVFITGQTIMGIVIGLISLPLVALVAPESPLARLFGWRDAPAVDLGLLLLLGVVATLAHMLVTRSLKLAPASVVVPYQYTTIVWAVILGYVVFGHVPAANMFVGCAIIVLAGIYIFWREQVRSREAARAAQPAGAASITLSSTRSEPPR